MHKDLVQILLSTYNGASFIEEQIDSILKQSYKEWVLIIRDDGSSDNTEAIIDKYAQEYPTKIKRLTGGEGGNASSSFMSMLSYADAPYIMFCDQDDVWMADKIADSLAILQEIERRDPLALVYTDMEVVSSDLKTLYSSFLRHQKLKPEWSQNAYAVFAQSMAAGCSMVFTQALVKKLHPIKAPLFQHDHWVLMHAAYYGSVKFLNKPTMHYRQHFKNAVGSHEINFGYFTKKMTEFKNILKRWSYIRSSFEPKVSIFRVFIFKLKISGYRLIKTYF